MAKKFIIGFGAIAVVLGLALGVMLGFNSSKGDVTSAEVPKVPGSRTNERIEALKAELDRVTQYETAYGQVKRNERGDAVFYGESKKRVEDLHNQLVAELRKFERRSPAEVAQVENNVKAFVGNNSLTFTFKGTSANPYTNNGKRIEFYDDNRGLSYMVDPTTNRVVQINNSPEADPVQFTTSPKKTMDEARAIAEEFLAKLMNPKEVKSGFKYKENYDEVDYGFRWESKTKPKGEDMEPFIQIILSPAGELKAFSDTRSLYSQN